jgi:hypothetical protein
MRNIADWKAMEVQGVLEERCMSEHGRQQYKECGGSSVCEHGRQMSTRCGEQYM